MDRNRGLIIVGGGVALLASAVALTLWNRKRSALSEPDVKAIDSKGKPITKRPKRAATRRTHAKNGKVMA